MSNLTQYRQPTDLFAQMRKEMDEMFGNWFARRAPALAHFPSAETLFAPIEVKETETEYVVQMDLPGMLEKDIKVNFQNETLTISGERKQEKAEGKGESRYVERAYGTFMRSIAIPSAVKGEEIRARYRNGVIEVHLPKAQKTATREIKVESAV